jgi:hypothetical protein
MTVPFSRKLYSMETETSPICELSLLMLSYSNILLHATSLPHTILKYFRTQNRFMLENISPLDLLNLPK